MTFFKKTLLVFSLLGVLLLPLHFAHAAYGLEQTAGAAGLGEGSRYPSDVPTLIGNVIGTALSMIAVIFFLLMVYGGFLWMTAHGDSSQVDKAKDTIIAAVIGIIVVLASYAITNFVFNATGGSPQQAPTSPPGNPGAQQLTGCCIYTNSEDNIKKAIFGHSNDTCQNICTIGEGSDCRVVQVANEAACNIEL